MEETQMKKIMALVLVLAMALAMMAGCSSNQKPAATAPAAAGNTEAANAPAADGLPLAGKKFAYILNVVSSDIFQMAANAAKETAEALGATVDVYLTDTDNTKFQDTVSACSNQGYDGMFLSHGNQESALKLVKDLRSKGIEVVCFDTQFVDDSGANVNGSLEGVTQMFQNDQDMARMLLDYLLGLYPEKVAAGEPIKLLKIWRGPGIAPFDRRQEGYKEYEDKGLIETVEVIAPSDPKNGESSMSDVMSATLPKYADGSIDGLWCCYDAYGRGAYVAMKEAGRTDIPMVSVDISNQDINFMIDGSNVWQACATVDFTTIGQQGIRILAMKLMGDETEAVYNLTPSLVSYDQLNADSNVTNLGEVVENYGINNDHIPDWMAPYIAEK